MSSKFTVKYKKGDYWTDLLPGLTGFYDWALKVSSVVWKKNGYLVSPSDMRIYEVFDDGNGNFLERNI